MVRPGLQPPCMQLHAVKVCDKPTCPCREAAHCLPIPEGMGSCHTLLSRLCAVQRGALRPNGEPPPAGLLRA